MVDVPGEGLNHGLQGPISAGRDDDFINYRRACKDAGIDTRILMVPPFSAIEYGYNLYLAVSRAPGSLIQTSAELAVKNMQAYFANFAPQSTSGAYVSALLMAGNSFASGIGRRKKALQDRIDAAGETHRRFNAKFARGKRINGHLIGGFKLLLLGGLIAVLAFAVNSLAGYIGVHLQNESSDKHFDPKYFTLTVTAGLAFIGSWVSSWWVDRSISKADKAYEDAVQKANELHAVDAMNEYFMAASAANTAWSSLTNLPPPTTPAMENLIRSAITQNYDASAITSIAA